MEYWVWLSQMKGVGARSQRKLLEHFMTPRAVYEASEEELRKVPGIGNVLSDNILSARSLADAYDVLEKAHQKGINILTYSDPMYPDCVKTAFDAPAVLYYKGKFHQDMVGVAIVGSRRCSEYGKRIAVEAAGHLANNGVSVISGMAKGVDGYAHVSCIKSGGFPVAFLGSGLDVVYPKEHQPLMEGIVAHGVAISEYPPGTKARPEHFPQRNRLISAFSRKILVAEAGENSGALITAEHGKKMGREVFAPPHSIYGGQGKGCNQLLQQGATLYLAPEQLTNQDGIIEEHHRSMGSHPNLVSGLGAGTSTGGKEPTRVLHRGSAEESLVLKALFESPKTIGELGTTTGIGQIALIETLAKMEIDEMIERYPGGRFIMK